MSTHLLQIGGRALKSESGANFEVRSPFSGEIVALVADASQSDAESAITAASNAFVTWRTLDVAERSSLMRGLGSAMHTAREALAQQLTLEIGKPIAEARLEVASSIEYINFYAEEAKRIIGEYQIGHTVERRHIRLKQPVGPCAIITPWNAPLQVLTRKLGAALGAGCSVVIKPAEQAPCTAIMLAELANEARLPAGLMNVVPCSRPEAVGDVLIEDQRIRKLSFTGSSEVGKELAARCAQQMKAVTLELGGHAPFIVFADADVDLAARACVTSKSRVAGQTCTAPARLIVHASVAAMFEQLLLELVGQLQLGDGRDPSVTMGPLIDEAALRKVERHVADALGKGARVLAGGTRAEAPTSGRGLLYPPTVLANVSSDMTLMHEETFGPVYAIRQFQNEQEAVRIANDTDYGLAAYVFTNDLSRAVRVSEALECGIVGINESSPVTPLTAFGGHKQSGQGLEGGADGLEQFLLDKLVSFAVSGGAKVSS